RGKDRFRTGDILRIALERLKPDAGAERSVPEGNPYRGLEAFEAEHRSLFFGRRADIGTIIEKLCSDPMVVVVGESGVGKSSVCRAGVIPLLEETGLNRNNENRTDKRAWSVITLMPG